MGDVVYLQLDSRLPIPSERVLQGALDAGVEDVVVIGRTSDGAYYYASAPTEKAQILWLLERMKHMLMELP